MSERPEFPPIESAPSRHIWIWALAGAALVVGLIWVARRAPAPAAVRPAAAVAAIAEVKPAAPAEAAKPVPAAAKAPESPNILGSAGAAAKNVAMVARAELDRELARTKSAQARQAAEPVRYPVPATPPPPVQAADGKWAETEDSPALRVSRAWVKLGQAAGVERSEGTRRLDQAWKNGVAQGGTHGRAVQAAHAKFLAAYKKDLDQARGIYEGVLRDVDSMDADGAEGSSGGAGTVAGGPAREAQEQIRAAERAERRTNSGCFLSPETCQQGDPADKALQDEISALVKGTLEAGGPDGGLSLYALRRKAGLLALRARVMAAVTQRAAARLATDVATLQGGQGATRSVPSPVAPLVSVARRSVTPASDPYR